MPQVFSEVAPKPHLDDLEPHLRAHPPHLQLSPAHLSLVPAHLGHLHPILVHRGPKFGLLGPSDEPRPHKKNLVFCCEVSFHMVASRPFGPYLAHLDLVFADLEPVWGHIVPSWAHLGVILAILG